MDIRDEDSFIEAMARVLGAGMPPMAGRMWAYLAICEPPERTAAEISERLRASRSSVSGMARILEQSGLIRRGTKPGDRREYFYVPPDAARPLGLAVGALGVWIRRRVPSVVAAPQPFVS